MANTRSILVSYDRELLDASSRAFERVSSLATEDQAVSVLVIGAAEKDVRIEYGTFSVYAWRGGVLRRLSNAILAGIRLARATPSLVSGQDPFVAGAAAYSISRCVNVPLEIQEHGDFFSGWWQREHWSHRAFAWLGGVILRRAERVRAVSERVKDHLVRLGVSAKNVEVIPVAQDVSALLERTIVSTPAVTRLVAPCRFVPQKGLDMLLESVRLLKSQGISFQLSLIGAGLLEARLRSRIESLDLADRVLLMPWKDQEQLWQDADIFVLSSRYEGWGRTIVEAMSAGVPIVTTDVGCVGSFFRPQIDGRVVQPNDASALATAIREQIQEPERRKAMRVNARERVRSLPTQAELHAQQRAGWDRVLHAQRDVGPRWELWVLGFFLFAIVSRAASVVLFHSSLVQREWGFYTLVDHWFQGFGYSYARELGCASAYRSPGYLFFLTALYSVFSPTNTWAQAIVQNIFVVGVLWLVYAVGKRLVGKRAALVGGFLMALYPYTFYHYTQYYHTFLSSFFLLLLCWMLLRLVETKRYVFAVGAGVSIGCLAYVQGTILPATPFLVSWLLWRLWPDWKRVVWSAVLMAVCSAGLIAPWTYRNWKELHTFVPLTTDLGHAFFKANNEIIYELTKRGYPQEIVDEVTVSSTNSNYKQYRLPAAIQAELVSDGVFQDSVAWTAWHPKEPNGDVATCRDLGPLSEVEFNRYWMQQGTAWFTTHWWPDGFKLQLLKLKTFWQPALFPSVKTGAAWSFAGNPLKVWLARNAVTAATALVIFGGWIGVGFAFRRRNRSVWLPVIFFVVYSFLHTFFAGYTKYRIPLDNLLAPYAGWVLISIWDACRIFIRRRLERSAAESKDPVRGSEKDPSTSSGRQ